MKYFNILLISLIFLSCNNKKVNTLSKLEEDIKYYESGNIKSKGYKLNGQFHGSFMEYFPDGNLKLEAYYKNGKQDSIQKVFFENGNIKQTVFFKDDLVDGKMEIFSDSGILIAEQYFVVINGASVPNQLITYDENGKIDKENSNYFKLYPQRDTIEYGESYEIDIKLEASYYNLNMLVIIGELDKNYEPVNRAKVDTLWDRSDNEVDFKVSYSTNQYQYGRNLIRGVIYDYASYYEEDDSGNIERSIRPLYFEKTFYVKEQK